MPLPESIEKDALKLDEKDRLHLLLKLLESFEPARKPGDKIPAWIEEAETRYHAWKSGEMKTIPEEEVFRRLRNNRKE